MFSSKTDQWATPQKFFDLLNEEFEFTLDPCADEFNHKCSKYYTREQNGLTKDWNNERVFCNPPYGKEIVDWVKKCNQEVFEGGVRTCCYVSSSKNGHKMVSRLYIPSSRDKIC